MDTYRKQMIGGILMILGICAFTFGAGYYVGHRDCDRVMIEQNPEWDSYMDQGWREDNAGQNDRIEVERTS